MKREGRRKYSFCNNFTSIFKVLSIFLKTLKRNNNFKLLFKFSYDYSNRHVYCSCMYFSRPVEVMLNVNQIQTDGILLAKPVKILNRLIITFNNNNNVRGCK